MNLIDILFVAFCLTQIADAYTTYIIIGKQDGRERNPLLLWLIEMLDFIPALITAKALAIFAGIYLYAVEPSPILLALLAAAYSWQVYQNWIRIKPKKE